MIVSRSVTTQLGEVQKDCFELVILKGKSSGSERLIRLRDLNFDTRTFDDFINEANSQLSVGVESKSYLLFASHCVKQNRFQL